jgi:hypothetical protein
VSGNQSENAPAQDRGRPVGLIGELDRDPVKAAEAFAAMQALFVSPPRSRALTEKILEMLRPGYSARGAREGAE